MGNLNTGPPHDDHARAPLLKLGDFGGADIVDKDVLADEYTALPGHPSCMPCAIIGRIF